MMLSKRAARIAEQNIRGDREMRGSLTPFRPLTGLKTNVSGIGRTSGRCIVADDLGSPTIGVWLARPHHGPSGRFGLWHRQGRGVSVRSAPAEISKHARR